MLTTREQATVRLLIIKSAVKLDAWSIHRMTGYDIADIELFLKVEPLPTSKAAPDPLSKLHGKQSKLVGADYKRQWELRQAAKEDLKDRPPNRSRSEHRRIVEAVYGV